MGFFDFFKKYNEHKARHMEWQKLVIPGSGDRLVATEKQLKEVTMQQAQDDLRIIKDCLKLIESTLNPDTFFMRLNLMVEKARHLCELEKYMSFSNISTMDAYDEIMHDYQKAISKFLFRYFSDTFDKAESLKTENGKRNRYKKFYDSLQKYYCFMNQENIDFIESKYSSVL